VIYDLNSGMLYVTTELDKTVSIIDPKTLKIVGSVPTGQEQSHMLVLTRDGSKGYTANVGPGTVSVLDMKGRKTLAIIPISKDTQRISISRDDSMVFTADQTKPQLAVIDTATNKVKTWVALAAFAYGTAATLDGRWLLLRCGPRSRWPWSIEDDAGGEDPVFRMDQPRFSSRRAARQRMWLTTARTRWPRSIWGSGRSPV
jgi:YVTN family beta-propeller protein